MLSRVLARIKNALVVCFLVLAPGVEAQTTVDLSDSPILASGRGPASNLLLSLSVEFPTVGAAYRGTTYDNNLRTLGYWDSDTCYTYVTTGLPTALTANQPGTGAPAGYFRRSRAATNFQCGGAGEYSGNFMNWAAQSAIDSLRYALTGGDRIYETASQTILQRADIPYDFYASGPYFPRKSAANANLYTPFTGTVYIVSCRYVVYIGSAAAGSCGNPGTNGDKAVLRAAVEVCNSVEGPVRTDLCKLQPSGYYKPTGLMQQYADKIRFSAFGYALDSGNARYGGVLRAPMKFVGQYAYDSAFNRITNPAPEWDPTTGVFVDAPLALQSGTTYSGVANYLNRFGRVTRASTALTTALTSSTMYKGNDPVGELYYEALRYIQGQAISPQVLASNGAFTAAMYDGFPIYTSWLSSAVPDPITSVCQNTSIIQIADAYTHNDKTIPGNSRTDGSGDSARSVGTGEPDAVAWTNTVGAFEVANPAPSTSLTSSLGTTNTGSSRAAYYIAGLAYWANTQSIRSDKPNIRVKTYVINVDENGNGTVTSRERNQQLYLAAKYGGFDNLNNDGSPFTTPPSGAAATTKWASGVDDNGFPLPKTFFLASSPQRMINSLRSAFASIARSTGTLAGGSVSGTRVTTTGTDAFVSRLDAQNDAGTVVAFTLTLNASTGAVTVANSPKWNATDLLTGNTLVSIPPRDPATRKIVTTQTDGTPIDFAWTSLDSAQQALFNKDPDNGTVDNLGLRRVAYLRGSRVDEVSKGTTASPKPFRDRTSLVASIVNSAPIYVGRKPSQAVAGDGYADFYRNMNRTPVVYVGTNNGMLHAFDAATGAEMFAFVPKALVEKLPATTSPNFVRQPMLDAPPVIAEAQVAFTGSASDWRSILVSGYGGGSQGIFALNVTDPNAFSANTSSVLWSFTDIDDPKMGNLTSSPKILKFKTGASSYKWFVVVPSGYNNNVVDTPVSGTPVRHDASNQSALFLLDLTKPASASWSLGSNYYRIDLPTSFQDSSKANALLSPGAELGVNGEVRNLYAGDIQGNLWKFNFSSATLPFTNANVLAFGGASGKPLFTAKDGSGNAQPITIEPVVGTAAGRTNLIVFGTGKFVEGADTTVANYKQQSMYGVWDDLTNTNASRTAARSELAQRAASSTGTTFSVSGADFVLGYPTNSSKKKGWYFDFPGTSAGERQVTNLAVANSFVYFNTLSAVTPSVNACAAYGGRQCAVNGATGLSSGSTCDLSSDGFLPAPMAIEPDVDIQTAATGQGYAVRSSTPLILTFVGSPTEGASNASAGKPLAKLGQTTRQQTRRLSWREIVDYDKLRESYK